MLILTLSYPLSMCNDDYMYFLFNNYKKLFYESFNLKSILYFSMNRIHIDIFGRFSFMY